MPDPVYSIGHSRHEPDVFLDLLQRHGITAVCDVRSKPFSRMNPQFNRDELQATLWENGIAYRFMGKELGGRSDDPACYIDGRVSYNRIAASPSFQNGLKRVIGGIKDFRIALMCAEKEPLDCHRTILVSRRLVEQGTPVEHIHPDGSLESHDAAVRRLFELLDMSEDHLFLSREELVNDAYEFQEKRIAYEADDTDASVGRGASE
jgi:uncharacterized protein (DUF488 family)